MWAVLYDDGMSLTTASERIARSLAEAERRRGHRVTVRRLDDAQTHPRGVEEPVRAGTVPEPAQAAEPATAPEPAPEPAPAPAPEPEPAPAPEPAGEVSPPEPIREPGPARAPTPAGRRRLLVYALAAASIVVAAALADHWGVLPRVGAATSSSPTQVGGSPHRPQLLPPLNQPPVTHFSDAADAGGGPATISRGG
jgi:outer membrane biosynthesis protein TonB